jgi:hypothetical protein
MPLPGPLEHRPVLKVQWYKERHLIPNTPELKVELKKSVKVLSDMLNSLDGLGYSLVKRSRAELAKCRDVLADASLQGRVSSSVARLAKEINRG